MKLFYYFILAAALIAGGYIYGYQFNQLSESMLVQYSPLVLLPIGFAVNGLISESRQPQNPETVVIDYTQTQTQPQPTANVSTDKIFRHSGVLGILLIGILFPAFFIRLPSLITATLSTLIWAAELAVFLLVIFPML